MEPDKCHAAVCQPLQTEQQSTEASQCPSLAGKTNSVQALAVHAQTLTMTTFCQMYPSSSSWGPLISCGRCSIISISAHPEGLSGCSSRGGTTNVPTYCGGCCSTTASRLLLLLLLLSASAAGATDAEEVMLLLLVRLRRLLLILLVVLLLLLVWSVDVAAAVADLLCKLLLLAAAGLPLLRTLGCTR